MIYPNSVYTARMNEQQMAWFYAEYDRARKEEVAGVLFAIFLGGLGIQYFYLGRNALGMTYLLLSWTGIPSIVGFIDAFFMPSRVREYNVAMASMISNHILAGAGMQAPLGTMPVGSV
jgi:TM2 domain-containing membrane protein YozV